MFGKPLNSKKSAGKQIRIKRGRLHMECESESQVVSVSSYVDSRFYQFVNKAIFSTNCSKVILRVRFQVGVYLVLIS